MSLILIRGLPGSGKSTLASGLLSAGQIDAHFEADMWVDYSLPFESRDIKAAHECCQQATRRALKQGKRVAVANTFTRLWEMQPYFDMADELNAPVHVIVATGNFKNVHGVPDEAIKAMRDRWENYSGC